LTARHITVAIALISGNNGDETHLTGRAISTHILDLIALRLRRPKAAAYARRDCTRSRRISRATSIKMDLSIAAVAARHAVTPRHLHKLFETEGATFSEYVLTCYLGSPIAY
jgi:AraC-like DNA-binding protein